MKIAAVQFKSVAGDVHANINRHIDAIELAVKQGADLIYFPELSISGYEPKLAKSLAVVPSDDTFDVFQVLSDRHSVIIGIGVPLASAGQVQIGMIWFEPHRPRASYAKQLLHADETPFFVPGDKQLILQKDSYRLAPAICYESLQPGHSENVAAAGADVYLASVAKSTTGITKAMQHYPETARKHNMCVVLANCVGPCDDFVGAGGSAAWNSNGQLLGQMGNSVEGILMVDFLAGNTFIVHH